MGSLGHRQPKAAAKAGGAKVAERAVQQARSASTSGSTGTVRKAALALDKELRKQALAAKRGESTLAAKGGGKGGKGGGKNGAPKAKPKAKPKAAPLPGTVPVGSAGVQAEGGLVGPSALCWCSGGRARPAQNGGAPRPRPPA